MPDRATLAVYLTPHGNGHAARVCDILHAVMRRRPGLRAVIVARHPEEFLRSRLPVGDIEIRADAFDTGMVQRDSVRADVAASLAAALGLLERWPVAVESEARWLAAQGAGAVLCDIPAIPLEAARRAGVPALAVGNFSWNWIYEAFAPADQRWHRVAEAFREGYAAADLLLRLPFHEPMSAFPRIEDVPLVARAGRARREELAREHGADPSAVWGLLCFSALDWTPEALARAAGRPGFEWFTVRPLAWEAPRFHAVDRRRFPFVDTLASCDVVVTKPGFGIVSEAIVHQKPVVYVHRRDWPEAEVLVAGLRRHGWAVEISAEDLYAGRLHGAIAEALELSSPREPIASDGGERAARRILDHLGA